MYESPAAGAFGTHIVEDAKGRLVFVGSAKIDGGGSKWLVNLLLGGGAGDASFNGGQPQQFTIDSTSTSSNPQACCVALQTDGKIVVSGNLTRPLPGNTYGYYFGMARFYDTGVFDFDWGGVG